MSDIWVGQEGLTWDQAVTAAHIGDVLWLLEGEYHLDLVALRGVRIIGHGHRDRTVVHAQFNVGDGIELENLTIRAPHFSNAIKAVEADATVHLTNVAIHGEGSGKYPAIHVAGATVHLTDCDVQHASSARGVNVAAGGHGVMTNSSVGALLVDNGRATLRDVTASTVHAVNRAHITSSGALTVTVDEASRSLYLIGESRCSVESLIVTNGAIEAFCSESYLALGEVDVPPDAHYLVYTESAYAVVETASPHVVIVGDHGHDQVEQSENPAEDPAEEPADGPRVVTWAIEDARSFASSVVPRLRPGDTVRLEAGDYYLEDFENSVLITGVDLIGSAAPEETTIHGSVVVMAGADVTVANVTLRPPSDRNALQVDADSTLTVRNVIIRTAPDAQFPAIYARGGRLAIEDCVMHVFADRENPRVVIDDRARLDASDSGLGWLQVCNSGDAQVSDCTLSQLWAYDGATVRGTGDLEVLPNTCGLVDIRVESGAGVSIETLRSDADPFTARVDAGSLEIGWLDSPEGSAPQITYANGAGVKVDGANIAFSTEDDLEDTEIGQVPPDPSAPDPDDPLRHINELIGLQKVKDQIRRFTRFVVFNQRRQAQGLATVDRTMHSLFLGNPGTGKTTVARLLGRALHEAGAVRSDTFVTAERKDLVGTTLGSSATQTQAILERARGGVLFIDEAYTLYQKNNNEFAQEAVDTLLKFIDDHRDEIVVIFAGYTDRMQDFLGMNPGMKSRIPHEFHFEDYTPDELAEIGYRALVTMDYTVNKDLYRRIVKAKYAQSSDQSNARWVRNFNEALIDEMVEHVMEQPDASLQHIADEYLYSLVGGDSHEKDANVEILLEQLDGLVGLDPVKDWVRDLIDEVTADRRLQQASVTADPPAYHMVFTGNPGTGKTTVAGIIAQLFYNLGILERPTVKEVDRSDLVGSWVGHTEENTTRILHEAMGGVLFVDEAYQLTADSHSSNDYGPKAVETMLQPLEDDRDKFVAIFAGYTAEMDRFLGSNPGLRSRIPKIIEFPDYTPEQVGHIVVGRLKRHWQFDEDLAATTAAQVYAALPAKDRSNGRWARTFAEEIEKRHKQRIARENLTTDDEVLTIRAETIKAAADRGAPEDTATKQATLAALLEQLDGLVGLDPVKDWVRDLIDEVTADRRLQQASVTADPPAYHMVFTGNPGTGKTTVAGIIAQLFYNLGILERPTVKEVDRSDLVGSWVGHTEENTTRILHEAMGGVLFVDEAYQLTADSHSSNDYGPKAVETMLQPLEDDRDKFVAIFAGYTAEMDRFLGSNPGLRSRIPKIIEFPDYTPEQVGHIVVGRLKRHWQFDEDLAATTAAQVYAALPAKDRSNGRWARTFAEEIEKRHKQRIARENLTTDDMRAIAPETISAAADQWS
ncbi:MAG: AAA family ATPase [Actinomycetia bacterium]|nr:AAA family ATPase [Actinomycetes bacterium]